MIIEDEKTAIEVYLENMTVDPKHFTENPFMDFEIGENIIAIKPIGRPPEPKQSATAEYLEWLHQDGNIINLFVTSKQGAWFQRNAELEEYVLKECKNEQSIWITINKALQRSPNNKLRIADVAEYQFLAFDIDPKYSDPALCATEAEHLETLHVAQSITNAFIDDLPTPLIIDSGNGHYLLYPITLLNTAENRPLMKAVLEKVKAIYQTVDIDTCTADPSRVLGLVGTWNRKRRSAEGRPHRLRKVIGNYPDREPMTEAEFVKWAKAFTADGIDFEAAEPERKEPNNESSIPLDLPWNVKKAKKYLAKCEPATQGENGDTRTYSVAGHLIAHRLSVETVHEIMLDSEWNRNCSPPWAADELMVKVRSAASNGTPRECKADAEDDDYDDIELIYTNWDEVDGDIGWLWQDRIPLEGISLFAGIGGVGKSTISLDLAAAITSGGILPDGTKATPADVLFFSAEDNDKILKIRFKEQGGNLQRFYHCHGKRMKEKEYFFTVDDIRVIEKHLKKHPETKLVIIDPISSFTGNVNTHMTSEVRRIMHPLAKLCERRNIAVLAISHFGKNEKMSAAMRISGSAAWRDLARSVHVVARAKEDEEQIYFIHEKHNYSSRQPTMAYRIGPDGKVIWELDVPNLTADEAFKAFEAVTAPKLANATEWLREFLAEKKVEYKHVIEQGQKLGISKDRILRAAETLEVVKAKDGFQGASVWSLPQTF